MRERFPQLLRQRLGGEESLDAVALMHVAGLEPDPWQLRVAHTPGDQLLLCHRQAGKSTIVAAIALEDACAAPDTLVLLVSRSMRQSGELFRKVKQFYALTRPLPLIQDSMLSLELENHSRIISLPGTEGTIVGYSKVTRLILDEAARIADATYYAVRPMLALSGGSLLCLSTPFGQRGFFYEAWHGQPQDEQPLDQAAVEAVLADLGMTVDAVDPTLTADTREYHWSRTKVPAPESRRLSPRFLANERRKIPDLWFRQEWLCEFVALGGQVFRREDIDAMLSDDVFPLGSPQAREVLADLAPLGATAWPSRA